MIAEVSLVSKLDPVVLGQYFATRDDVEDFELFAQYISEYLERASSRQP